MDQEEKATSGHVIDRSKLPDEFPTNYHSPEFWEALGRAVGTFGLLEETLAKAIFAITATKEIPEDQIEVEYGKWIVTLERALTDSLGGLIDAYSKAVSDNPKIADENLQKLISGMREAAKIRNAICHGSWRMPDVKGRSVPFYVNRKLEIFETPVDIGFLKQLQTATMDLVMSVMDSVTMVGWQFPGSGRPGTPLSVAKELGG